MVKTHAANLPVTDVRQERRRQLHPCSTEGQDRAKALLAPATVRVAARVLEAYAQVSHRLRPLRYKLYLLKPSGLTAVVDDLKVPAAQARVTDRMAAPWHIQPGVRDVVGDQRGIEPARQQTQPADQVSSEAVCPCRLHLVEVACDRDARDVKALQHVAGASQQPRIHALGVLLVQPDIESMHYHRPCDPPRPPPSKPLMVPVQRER